jgi:hypothetical protein
LAIRGVRPVSRQRALLNHLSANLTGLIGVSVNVEIPFAACQIRRLGIGLIPADNRWFVRIMVAAATIEALERLQLKFLAVEGKALTELKKVRRALLAERGSGGR